MNRRNLEFLVPYNPRATLRGRRLQAGNQATAGGRRHSGAGDVRGAGATVGSPPAERDPRGTHELRREAGARRGRRRRGRRRGPGGDAFVKASGAAHLAADLAAHCSDILAGAYASSTHSDEVLVEYRVQADPVLGAISYRGVPDVRVLVFRGVPVQAMIRLPTRASDGRANLHMGGMAVGVDLATGVTTDGVLARSARSPGIPISTARSADWRFRSGRRCLRIAARCYDAIPLGYLGVDLVLDAELGPLVLELNARPGLTFSSPTAAGSAPRWRRWSAADLRDARYRRTARPRPAPRDRRAIYRAHAAKASPAGVVHDHPVERPRGFRRACRRRARCARSRRRRDRARPCAVPICTTLGRIGVTAAGAGVREDAVASSPRS